MNNEILLTIASASVLMLLLISFLIVFAIIFKKRQSRFRQEKATLQAQYQQEMLQTRIEVQNSTLQQISSELHDNIGQLLSVARINLNILEEMDLPQESREYVVQTNEIIENSIYDLRALTKSLDGDFVKDFGIEESLSFELARIRKTGKFVTELIISGEKYFLGYEKEIVLFRLSQEALQNVLKHSKAMSIVVGLQYSSHEFVLSLKDDGIGFDPISIAGHSQLGAAGAGLRNMRRRAELIGGTFTLTSNPLQGTFIKIELSN